MIEVVVNELRQDGMRRLKVISDVAFDPSPNPSPNSMEQERYLERGMMRRVPEVARSRVQVSRSVDEALGIHSLEVAYPVYGPFDVAVFSSKKFRRLFFVNYVYGSRVSECIELARVEFFSRTKFAPSYAFVKCLPAGVEDGIDVHGLFLIQAEWMPEKCVGVGGIG